MPNASPENRRAQRQRSKQRKRDWVGYLKLDLGCHSCGWIPDKEQHWLLDLDHLPEHDAKLANVSDLISEDAGWPRILTELLKCQVVCRPCHIDRTTMRQWKAAGLTPPTDLPDPF